MHLPVEINLSFQRKIQMQQTLSDYLTVGLTKVHYNAAYIISWDCRLPVTVGFIKQ